MLAKFRPRSVYDVMAALSLFLVIAGGSAYAANTVFSTDIVDGQVKTPDLAGTAVTNSKLGNNSVGTGKVADNSLAAVDLAPGSVGASEVADNSLGGADVLESSLAKVPAASNADKLAGIAAGPVVRLVAAGATDHDRCAEVPPATAVFCTRITAPASVSGVGITWAPPGSPPPSTRTPSASCTWRASYGTTLASIRAESSSCRRLTGRPPAISSSSRVERTTTLAKATDASMSKATDGHPQPARHRWQL